MGEFKRFNMVFSGVYGLERAIHATTVAGAKREATAWARQRGPGTLALYCDGVRVASRDVFTYGMGGWR